MVTQGIPTSSDIYLEVNGRKVAVVQSYTAQTTKSSTTVEAFGESEPVAAIPGQSKHQLELTRIYATDEAIALGNSKTYNMLLLGALLKVRDLIPDEAIIRGLEKTLPERHHHLIPLNREAIERGKKLVK